MANLRELWATPFKVHLKMHYPMTLTILDNLLFLIGVLLMPVFHADLYYFVSVYVLTTLPGFLIQFYFLRIKFNYKLSLKLYKVTWLLKESLPLAGFVLLTIVFQQVDVVLLTSFKDSFSAGIYSAATRLTMPLNIIPTVVVTTVFPVLVKNLQDKSKTDTLLSLVYKVLFLIAFVLAVVVSFKSGSIVTLVFGKNYSLASIPTFLLFWAQIFIFFNFFTLDLLTAHNKQFWNLIYSLVLVVSNIVFNIIFIPHYSYTGVAISKVIASFMGFLFLLIVLDKNKITMNFVNFRFISWIVVICGAVYAASRLSLIPYLVASAIIIIAALILLRYFTKDEWDIILRLLNKQKWGKYVGLK